MLRTGLFALSAAAAFTASAAAQICSDNTYPLHLVNSTGTPFAHGFDAVINDNSFFAPNENVYLAFPTTLPSGTYYVHVTDNPHDGFDEVLSTNDPMDRFVTVTNNAGVISLSLPFTNSTGSEVFGVGLNGVGQSLRLTPFDAPTFSQCRFLVCAGNAWDLTNGPSNPYLLQGGPDPLTGQCRVRSYKPFRIGDGNGSDVGGVVFNDADRDGVRDATDAAMGGREVRLVTGTTVIATTTTAADGSYNFGNVAEGPYSVEVTVPGGYIATNAASHAVTVCACADVAVDGFGLGVEVLPANARNASYWLNHNGRQKIQQFNILPTLPSLHIVNTCGQYVAPGNMVHYGLYMLLANAWNMGYLLSEQMVAMHCNLVVGYVHPSAVINDPQLGTMTVGQLMTQSIAALVADPYTPPNTNNRTQQTRLKNALQRANNNQIWQ
jgi:hypothetical protein